MGREEKIHGCRFPHIFTLSFPGCQSQQCPDPLSHSPPFMMLHTNFFSPDHDAGGSAMKQSANLLKMRESDVAAGGGDHKLMVRQKAIALGDFLPLSPFRLAAARARVLTQRDILERC